MTQATIPTPDDIEALEPLIQELRRLINEPSNTAPWTDLELATRIVNSPNLSLRGLAASVWREKAAQYSGLVDMQEGNSRRNLSQLYKQALQMAESLDDVVVDDRPARRPARTRPIERM